MKKKKDDIVGVGIGCLLREGYSKNVLNALGIDGGWQERSKHGKISVKQICVPRSKILSWAAMLPTPCEHLFLPVLHKTLHELKYQPHYI